MKRRFNTITLLKVNDIFLAVFHKCVMCMLNANAIVEVLKIASKNKKG